MNIFECSLNKEREAIEFYRKLARSAVVPELRTMFTILAEAEEEHAEAITRMMNATTAPPAEFTTLEGASCAFRPLLDRRELAATLRHDTDAYRTVMTQEEESVRFYEELAAGAGSEESKQLLLSLAEEERRHLSIVENIYSFVESPRTYLAWGEFSNLNEY